MKFTFTFTFTFTLAFAFAFTPALKLAASQPLVVVSVWLLFCAGWPRIAVKVHWIMDGRRVDALASSRAQLDLVGCYFSCYVTNSRALWQDRGGRREPTRIASSSGV